MEGFCMSKENTKIEVQDLVLTGLFIALVYVFTRINIKLPFGQGGLIHLGTFMLYTITILFGKRKGAIAGGFGMGLFDLLSEWAAWAPYTFVIRIVMGYIVGAIAWGKGKNGNHVGWNIFAMLIGGIWMIAGYYVSQIMMYGDVWAPIKSIPGDVTQVVVGMILAVPAITALKRVKQIQHN